MNMNRAFFEVTKGIGCSFMAVLSCLLVILVASDYLSRPEKLTAICVCSFIDIAIFAALVFMNHKVMTAERSEKEEGKR